ncbi:MULTISPECIES: c-type cytochrome [Delftia]|uniref:c-type cytochrome n=1 Tax=Delftia TaxID=80865 RepID=UPI000773B449|nr:MULTISPECIES: c-type cytochrome [Delftia]MCX7507858.1 c-type cytochrome [Delftia tsuruhatensis]MDH0776018.1 c-type cytochrome [Delftia tsuruhatensis]MDH1460888.1 c-type cytochrome [Delftia tsuruhatensis]MDH1825374.1 c-type cytochrome [Delftia tsuruhatensis]MDR6731034.1 cytochrome c551/c552 [Delftia lacustris]
MAGQLPPGADDEGDDAPQRPRWLGWALVVFMLLVALGVFNIGWRIMRGPAVGATTAPAAAAVTADAQLAAGKALVEGNDCLRCHGLVRHYVGPSFQQIAGRYRGREDAADYLARKIREGGAGEWGRAIMPRHPHIDTAQSLQMAAWLLSLPSPEPGKS